MSKLFQTIHLGQKILYFKVPMEIVDEINLTYQNNIKDLKKHNHYLAAVSYTHLTLPTILRV